MLMLSFAFALALETAPADAAVQTQAEKPTHAVKIEENKKPEEKKPEPPAAWPNAELKPATETITIVADFWCPYNCLPDSEKSGYMVDLAKAIFAEQNIKVNYKIMPWERSLSRTKEGEYEGVIGLLKKEGGDDFIYPENKLGININYFYVKSPSNWRYKNYGSLQFVTLGLIQGYGYGDIASYVNAYKDDNLRIQTISSENALEKNIKKLLAGRITAIYEDKFVADYYLQQIKMNDMVINAGTAHKKIIPENDYVYIGFSKKNPKSEKYAKILSSGIEKFRKNGKLDEIMKKYNLQDWEKVYVDQKP